MTQLLKSHSGCDSGLEKDFKQLHRREPSWGEKFETLAPMKLCTNSHSTPDLQGQNRTSGIDQGDDIIMIFIIGGVTPGEIRYTSDKGNTSV